MVTNQDIIDSLEGIIQKKQERLEQQIKDKQEAISIPFEKEAQLKVEKTLSQIEALVACKKLFIKAIKDE